MSKQLKATQLADLLSDAKAKEAEIRAQLKEVTDEQDRIKDLLLTELETKRIKSVDSGGYIFTSAMRSGYEIVDEDEALSWAMDAGCVSVNRTKMAKALKGAGALPKGIEYKETAYISVSTIKDVSTD